MKVIREANGLKSLFPQYYEETNIKDVVLSHYTHMEQISEDKYILFSFVSDAIISLTKEEVAILKSDNYDGCHDFCEKLQKEGFFIKKTIDESSLMYKHRLSFESVDTDLLKVVILPTTRCNARCPYCCGEKNPNETMTLKIAEKVVDTIVSIAERYKNIQFGWYGGEPLLESNIITFICEEIKRRLPEINYSSYIISNTFLFDKHILKKMVECWKVKRIGITFDGTEREHNSRKNFYDSSINAFNQTLNSIQPLLDNGILVQCRFNADKNNITQLKPLIKVLTPYLGNNLFYFYVAFLKGDDSHKEFYDKTEYNSLVYEIGKIYKEFNMKKSIDGMLLNVFLKWCQGKSKNSITIGPTGDIYKCNLVDLIKENAIGSVYTGIDKNSAYKNFVHTDIEQKCLLCKFFPICQGGCPADERKESSSVSKCNEFKYRVKGVAKVLSECYN